MPTDPISLLSQWLSDPSRLVSPDQEIDTVIIVGSSLISSLDTAKALYDQHHPETIVCCGGIGHSTKDLWENVALAFPNLDPSSQDRPEAEIFAQLLPRFLPTLDSRIVIENRSTNCGANAHETRKELDKVSISPRRVAIIQDPTMQVRTRLSFERAWQDQPNVQFFSAPAPVDQSPWPIWSRERYVSLLLGEIPRLRDDENGYGPRGKNFFDHVEIPVEVEEAWTQLSREYAHLIRS